MIKTYTYEYNDGDASATIQIDTEKIYRALVKEALNFSYWDYDESADPYDELARIYCGLAMGFASSNNHNTFGVIRDFAEAEGLIPMDGSVGIKLIDVAGIDWSEVELDKI